LVGVRHHQNHAHTGQRLAHHFKKFELEVLRHRHGGDACDISAGMGEARGNGRGQAGPDDRNCARQLLYGGGRKDRGDDDGVGVKSQQLGCERRKTAGVAVRPTVSNT
jgi:hypothetical protein